MKTSEDMKEVLKGLDRIVWAALGALFLVYVLSGFYQVQASEMGVVFRFGARYEVSPPGIHYSLPWPIDQVKKVNVKKVQRLEVGFYPTEGMKETLLPYCITGDKNIIHNRYVIQYRVADPANFLAGANRVSEILAAMARAVIVETVAGHEVDPLLTIGKTEMQFAVKQGLMEKLRELNLRIQILGVERQSADPPMLAKEAFQDVTNAREEKRTKIHDAEDYDNQEIPKAKGDASMIVEQSRAWKARRVSAAKGESQRFLKLYEEYEHAPDITRHRLFIELLEQTLPRVKVMVLAKDKDGKPIKVKLLQAPVPTTPRLME